MNIGWETLCSEYNDEQFTADYGRFRDNHFCAVTCGYNWAVAHSKATKKDKKSMSGAPRGLYRYESAFFVGGNPNIRYKATGEYRPPKVGEYLSGAFIAAHQAPNDLTTSYWIAKQVETVTCPYCNGTGKTEKDY